VQQDCELVANGMAGLDYAVSSLISVANFQTDPRLAWLLYPLGADHPGRQKVDDMKLVIAIIKPSRLEEVRQALNSLDVHGMTVTEVKGYGRQKGHSEIYRGTEYAVHFLPKLKVEIAVDDGIAEAVSAAIIEAAQTGRIGDGKIFVLDLLAVTRIRTGETGASAL
jgi:nitrogen regulatory protein P-II 2